MPSALILTSGGPGAPALAEDLAAVGVEVIGATDCSNLVQSVIKTAPDLVMIYEFRPDAALFGSIALVTTMAPRPVVVFTPDPDADSIAQATLSGVHAYVVNGYSPARLRSVMHLAQARFQREQAVREELAGLNRRFAERKLVDRAKGILMGARQLREEEAYRALRTAAMHGKQRIGQVSQQVIDAALYGEAVNRAGQLRMLSQRMVKLYALMCCRTPPPGAPALLADSIGAVEANLAMLARSLSRPTFGDLLDAVARPWSALRDALRAPAAVGGLQEVDAFAEQVLGQAEQLTANLEVAAFATALRVINVAGRQRMLSQRLAKEALLRALLGEGAGPGDTRAELEAGFDYLAALPLSNAGIADELAHAGTTWAALQAALQHPGDPAGQAGIASSSEALLAHLDRLTDQLERGLQVLVR
ncbi:MAG: type IV pili methyl-accepting chemotaxis transducer N-terminal domain-containing protein [Janthinobacterium lividum]